MSNTGASANTTTAAPVSSTSQPRETGASSGGGMYHSQNQTDHHVSTSAASTLSNWTPLIILIVIVIVLVVLGILYLRHQMTVQSDRIEDIAQKAKLALKDKDVPGLVETHVPGIVENMPQFQMLVQQAATSNPGGITALQQQQEQILRMLSKHEDVMRIMQAHHSKAASTIGQMRGELHQTQQEMQRLDEITQMLNDHLEVFEVEDDAAAAAAAAAGQVAVEQEPGGLVAVQTASDGLIKTASSNDALASSANINPYAASAVSSVVSGLGPAAVAVSATPIQDIGHRAVVNNSTAVLATTSPPVNPYVATAPPVDATLRLPIANSAQPLSSPFAAASLPPPIPSPVVTVAQTTLSPFSATATPSPSTATTSLSTGLQPSLSSTGTPTSLPPVMATLQPSSSPSAFAAAGHATTISPNEDDGKKPTRPKSSFSSGLKHPSSATSTPGASGKRSRSVSPTAPVTSAAQEPALIVSKTPMPEMDVNFKAAVEEFRNSLHEQLPNDGQEKHSSSSSDAAKFRAL